MTSEPSFPLDWTHKTNSVGARGLTVDRQATPAECERLKTALDVLSVSSYRARYTITAASGGFSLSGDFICHLEQACVVTLEAVPEVIAETLSVSFCPPGRHSVPEAAERANEHVMERPVLDQPDVELLSGDVIEAGRVLYELLSAGLDPYPRKAEAEFSWVDPKAAPDDAGKLHPFAALSKLKKNS